MAENPVSEQSPYPPSSKTSSQNINAGSSEGDKRSKMGSRTKTLLICGVVVVLLIVAGVLGGILGSYFKDYDSRVGLKMFPQVEKDSTLIKFIQGKPSSYKAHTDLIQRILKDYDAEQQKGPTVDLCLSGKPGKKKVCYFDKTVLGNECTFQNDFGYDQGKPCVLLQFNPPINWKPDPVKPDSENIPAGWNATENHVGVYCEGQKQVDGENIGSTRYFPVQGYHTKFFPYQKELWNYLPPVTFVQFTSLRYGVVNFVKCRIIAGNVSPTDSRFTVEFELMVD